ncbi:hypothetical protein [Methanocaldococcus fervens]|uniref:CRISPR type III-B/RAMP module-associated protein Cmr5 n=1 Tax=Methanocaldococcus fervens (strain DSM 4213 / JCM 15782 / AG86) TaxID=573064 RepID=C7P6D6_METFA|nr:hypothetical protein [Methanocaldococcus fervens]ACV24118.1 hypothetical protein Mefer_0281 [Methanocaldococcus fervens AG86]
MDKLEYKINEVAFNIAQILDKNEINKLLGVLANDGVYAMWVYALDKIKIEDKKDRIGLLINQILNFSDAFPILKENQEEIERKNEKIKGLLEKEKLNDEGKIELKNKIKERNKIILEIFKELSKDIDNLLFFKEILERVLILARYHAKALGDD